MKGRTILLLMPSLALVLTARPAGLVMARQPISTGLCTQDFDTLANTGITSTVPLGWAFSESGTNAYDLKATPSSESQSLILPVIFCTAIVSSALILRRRNRAK